MRSINRGVLAMTALVALAGLGAGGTVSSPPPADWSLWKRRNSDGTRTRSTGTLTDEQVRAMAEHEARCIKGAKNKRRRRKGGGA